MCGPGATPAPHAWRFAYRRAGGRPDRTRGFRPRGARTRGGVAAAADGAETARAGRGAPLRGLVNGLGVVQMRNCHTLLYSFLVRAGEYGITPLARPTGGRAAAGSPHSFTQPA